MILQENAKKVITKDANGKENGFLIELFKSGEKTLVYLSAALPGAFKGYHLHRVREARYICLKGKACVITYEFKNNQWIRSEHILDASKPTRLFVPKNVATGLKNVSNEESWLVNQPNPPYDPSLKDEQVEYTQEELERGIVK